MKQYYAFFTCFAFLFSDLVNGQHGNRYLYFFEKGNPQVPTSAIQGLVELIRTEMQSDTSTTDLATAAFFSSTLRYIQYQKQKGGVMGEKYDPVKL